MSRLVDWLGFLRLVARIRTEWPALSRLIGGEGLVVTTTVTADLAPGAETPGAEASVLRSRIRIDGDLVTFIDPSLLDRQTGIVERHYDTLRQRYDASVAVIGDLDRLVTMVVMLAIVLMSLIGFDVGFEDLGKTLDIEPPTDVLNFVGGMVPAPWDRAVASAITVAVPLGGVGFWVRLSGALRAPLLRLLMP